MGKRGKTIFNTSSIAYADIEQAIIFTAGLCQGIKSKLLHAVYSCYHIYPEQFASFSFKWKCGRISFPFCYYPLQFDRNGISITEIGPGSTFWFSVAGV